MENTKNNLTVTVCMLVLCISSLQGCAKKELPLAYIQKAEIESIKNEFDGKFCSKKYNPINNNGIAKSTEEYSHFVGKCKHQKIIPSNSVVVYLGDTSEELKSIATAELNEIMNPTPKPEPIQSSEMCEECEKTKNSLKQGLVINFDTDSWAINPEFIPELAKVAIYVTQNKSKITIIGHADSSSTEKHNMPLSIKRAESIAQMLYGYGVEKNLVSIGGKGSAAAIADNGTKEGRKKNRRAEINEGEIN